jgi:hypothetical protein
MCAAGIFGPDGHTFDLQVRGCQRRCFLHTACQLLAAGC